MSGGGGGSDTQDTAGQPISIDPGSLAEFMQTQQGAAHVNSYIPGASYYQSHTPQGEVVKAYAPGFSGSYSGGTDVSAMMADYTQWISGMAATKQNWQNYADQAAKFEGGQGDQTITAGAAVSQRSTLLGALANEGQTGPTPGLGSFGTIKAAGVKPKGGTT